MFGNIANSSGERLDYSFHEGTAGSRDIVVIGHGVTGNKDRPCFDFLKLQTWPSQQVCTLHT